MAGCFGLAGELVKLGGRGGQVVRDFSRVDPECDSYVSHADGSGVKALRGAGQRFNFRFDRG